MKCRRPFINNGVAFSCGQCDPCRLNKRRIWSGRLMLEAKLWSDNTVIGLSYAENGDPDWPEADYPTDELGRGILVKSHYQLFMKSFRKAVDKKYGQKVRFFAAGEYGDESWRPHFHIAMFNFPNCLHGESLYARGFKSCCVHCDFVQSIWRKGRVHLMPLNDHTAQYVCGYVTKKMTDGGHPALQGRPPEFSEMSRRPGIGTDAVWDIASTLLQFNLVDEQTDVPSALRFGNRLFPIGRFMRQKLRVAVGKDAKAPKETVEAIKEELRPLREAAFENSRSFKDEVVKAADQAVKNMEARNKIFRQRKDKL